MTEQLRKALLAAFKALETDREEDYGPFDPLRRKLQAVAQALEVENMTGVKVVKARKGRRARGQ